MDDTLKAAAAQVKQKLRDQVEAIKSDPRMAEVLKLQKGLNSLEDLLSEPHTSLSELFGLDSQAQGASVKPGEFYGLDPLDAAKRYLKRRGGEPRTLDEILNMLEIGGCQANRDDLRMSLSRSTYDVVKAAEDLYGLIEYFPHVKRGRKKKSNGEKQNEQAGEESGDQAEQDAGAGPITMQSDALDALKTKR
jgi:hypothetical protein